MGGELKMPRKGGVLCVFGLFLIALAPATGFLHGPALLQPGRMAVASSAEGLRVAPSPEKISRTTALSRLNRVRSRPSTSSLQAAVQGIRLAGPVYGDLRTPKPCPSDGKALVIFTGHGDLRVHDNAGLDAAASASAIKAIMVLDPADLAQMSDRRVTLLLSSVRDLQSSLKELSIALEILVGETAAEVSEAVSEFSPSHVYLHQDVTEQALSVEARVTNTLMSRSNGQLCIWNSALRSNIRLNSNDYFDYRKQLGRGTVAAAPLCASESQLESRNREPPAKGDVAAEFEDKLWAQIAEIRSDTLQGAFSDREGDRVVGDREAGGETLALKLWRRYLAGGETALESDLIIDPELGFDHISVNGGAVQGHSGLFRGEMFVRSFSELLALGCISPRLVLKDCSDFRWGRGPLSFGPDEIGASLEAASEAVERREWHRLLATWDLNTDKERPDANVFAFKYWRWRGHLIRYAEGGKTDANAPPVLLLHGFGASADQWERNFANLAEDHRVFAVDLIGFGHSEKPALHYSQYIWGNLAHDFALEMIGRPTFIGGNSLGGYFSITAGTSMKSFCQGVILCNSAGRMLSAEEYQQELAETGGTLREVMETKGLETKKAPGQWVLDLFGDLIIGLLRPNVASVTRKVYAIYPDQVDDRLVENIIRDSKDPGGYHVIAAGAKLPPPRTKNELFAEFGGPVLVAQGLDDPLGGGQARRRYDVYKEAHPDSDQVRLVGLEAGHCPHHEVPELYSNAVRNFVKDVVSGAYPEVAEEAPKQVTTR